MSAEFYKKKYQLSDHPEGGFYSVNYNAPLAYPFAPKTNSATNIPTERPISTGIYYLLTGKDFSAFHKIDSDEMWHYYDGNVDLVVHELNPATKLYKRHVVGKFSENSQFQCVIPAESWFAAELIAPQVERQNEVGTESSSEKSFALCGCTVSPGFMFQSFEMAKSSDLLKTEWISDNESCPNDISELITRLTRE